MAANVTIATVARHAKVSRQTVSNVLNAPDLVRAETRDRVRAAIDELGYRTNLAARQMRTGRSRLIAVRIDPVRDGIDGDGARPVPARPDRGRGDGRLPDHALHRDRRRAPRSPRTTTCWPRTTLDAFVLTDTHHGDARTAWLAEARACRS